MSQTQKMRRNFIASCMAIAMVTPLSVAAENDKSREKDKLKGKSIEQLSLGEVANIYIGCLESAVEMEVEAKAENADTIVKVSHGDLIKHCNEQRKLYESRTSKAALNQLETRYMSDLDKRTLKKDKSSYDDGDLEDEISATESS